MKVVYTRSAAADLEQIVDYLIELSPLGAQSVQKRLDEVLERIANWPESAAEVEGRPGLRRVPLVQYPYVVFYRVRGGMIRIIRIRHAARRPWRSD